MIAILLWPEELLLLSDAQPTVPHLSQTPRRATPPKPSNSGAYVRNSKDGAIWHQAQFGDSDGGFLLGVTMTASGQSKFFRLKDQVTSNRVKPAGEWNTIEITARGKTLTLWVNGANTCQFDGCDMKSGHVGVEGEGHRIEFRNLLVKELRNE